MRIYEYLDEIRRTLNAEESNGVPTPSWRIEEYLKDIYDAIQGGIYPSEEQVAEAVDAWLDDHPEATTTVEDGSITNAKLATSFVTPGVASAYSSSATYAVGDYVFYNGALYKFTEDHAAGAWTGTDVEQTLTATELEALYANKANVDGSYSSLTAGNAEQLVSTVGMTDKTPYLFRTTGGSADVGERVKVSEITGGTVAWNQLLLDNRFQEGGTVNDVTRTPSIGLRVTFDGTASATSTYQIYGYFPHSEGHKYFLSGYKKVGSNTGYAGYNGVPVDKGGGGIFSAPSGTVNIRVDIVSGDAFVNDTMTFMCTDLTAMFGSTIADYLYGLESGTAGAGIAKLKSWGFCTADYYAYDAGSLLSVKTSAHKEYGFNAYDNTTGKAKVVGGRVYQITGTYTALSLDGTSITPDASGYFTPAASGELTVTGGNSTDTCIHLKWDGERDGEYEPYEEHTYALDDVELRGIPKLDANNNLYYDGDSYEADGTVTRKYGIVDLGTLSWEKNSTYNYFYATVSGIVRPSAWNIVPNNIRCPLYTPDTANNVGGAVNDKRISGAPNADRVSIYDSTYAGSTKDQFKTAMNGVYFLYELATPTTESADPYQETQICNDFGTEEFVDSRTVPMPVGANALYQANLRAKLEMAPDSPAGDGDYIVRQTDGLNEYVPLEKELPTAPAEDGTYSLKCTVADGTATLSWVSDS